MQGLHKLFDANRLFNDSNDAAIEAQCLVGLECCAVTSSGNICKGFSGRWMNANQRRVSGSHCGKNIKPEAAMLQAKREVVKRSILAGDNGKKGCNEVV